MCGIAGVFSFNGSPVEKAVLSKMTDALTHRGPDGKGLYIDQGIGLGHRRLSVLDLTNASRQPMTSPDGRYTLVYNGELYNFQELREEIQATGQAFSSTGDAEVVLHSLIRSGADALPTFNGMFALAFWDAKERTLLIARDRYGTKPFYFTTVGKRFVFASEVKSFLSYPGFSVELNKEALLEYFTFQNIFKDHTFFQNVKLLPGGTSIIIREGLSKIPAPQRYWDFHFDEPEVVRTRESYIDELDDLFRKSVERQTISDVSIGSYLSGGMDTGSIAALATDQMGAINTFTVGFDMNDISGLEINFDEREQARELSSHIGSNHFDHTLQSGDMESAIPSIIWHLDEPRVGQCYPNYYASALASKHNKVVLSGTGGDEMFGGYPWRYYRASVHDDFEHFIDHYYAYWQRLIPDRPMKDVFAPIWNDVKHVDSRDIFSSVFDSHSDRFLCQEDYINHSFYFEAKTFLNGLLLIDDKLSMANGLETRYPFLDNDLVDFAMKLPVSMKLTNLGAAVSMDENQVGSKYQQYFEKTGDGKLLLREAMKQYVPDAVVNRRKQGFSGPDSTWFRGKSLNFVRKKLIEQDAILYNFLDRKIIHELVDDHLEGNTNRRLLIWSLLCVEEWCHAYLT